MFKKKKKSYFVSFGKNILHKTFAENIMNVQTSED